MEPGYLLDASIYIFRGWFAVDPGLLDEAGDPANAVHAYGNVVLDLLEETGADYALAAFDGSLATCFRNDIYPAYKANRPEAPPDLQRQMAVCEALTRALGVMTARSDRFEADDLIGTAAERLRELGLSLRFLTGDKDYAQLLRPGDRLLDVGRPRNLDCAGVEQTLGVRPDQVADLLGFAGDSVDNIPGIPGIGPRAATALLGALDSMEGVYAGLDRVPGLALRGAARCRRLLESHAELAWLSRELATIRCDAPLGLDPGDLRVVDPDPAALAALPLPARVRRRAEDLLEANERRAPHALVRD